MRGASDTALTFLANFGIADNSGVEQHNRHPSAMKRDAAQDPRRGMHQSGMSARRLGACAAQTLFVKPGLVADLHIVAVGLEHIGRGDARMAKPSQDDSICYRPLDVPEIDSLSWRRFRKPERNLCDHSS